MSLFDYAVQIQTQTLGWRGKNNIPGTLSINVLWHGNDLLWFLYLNLN